MAVTYLDADAEKGQLYAGIPLFNVFEASDSAIQP